MAVPGKEASGNPESGLQIIWKGNSKPQMPEGWSAVRGTESMWAHSSAP